MSSVKGEIHRQGLRAAVSVFAHKQISQLLQHQDACCLRAREWFLAMDQSLNRVYESTTPSTWVADHFKWGPSEWPMFWCEAMLRETFDCGVFAALTRESLEVRSIPALPTQIIRFCSEEDTKYWRALWDECGCRMDWISGSFAYHEVVALVYANELRVWDSTQGFWLDSELRLGFGHPVAIRVVAPRNETRQVLKWGTHDLHVNRWHTI